MLAAQAAGDDGGEAADDDVLGVAPISTHFFVTSAGFCENVFMVSALVRHLRRGRRRFLLLALSGHAAPNKKKNGGQMTTAASGWLLIGRHLVCVNRQGAKGGRKSIKNNHL